MSIAATEDWFIALIKQGFEGRLNDVDSLPAEWTANEYQRVLRRPPGVFVVYGGGERVAGSDAVLLNARWGFMVVTKHAGDELSRRRGDKRVIGAYEIVERLVPLLEGCLPPDAQRRAEVVAVRNMFDAAEELAGATVYGVDIQYPQELFPADGGVAPEMDDFLTFDGAYDLARPDGQREAEDLVQLPQ